ncbi:hypothetical protein K491DRAFT_72527 [Lophiostoma macrostomum CBS 122681]|uniref:Uncharacterized protein n=1 Tax=Lophiostoma macrostomum CBS 122681 TaxID=1314788 RepID=A0A6A6SWE9_9PLEO|nr:hypothetical protein K491DRAFT_72527 [Lophiostoma macrostomum CBS 122681]
MSSSYVFHYNLIFLIAFSFLKFPFLKLTNKRSFELSYLYRRIRNIYINATIGEYCTRTTFYNENEGNENSLRYVEPRRLPCGPFSYESSYLRVLIV